MPWRTACAMDQRTQFIAAWLQQTETVSTLCRQYRISRKTGYKLLGRYAAEGPSGLRERSCAHHQPRALSDAMQRVLLAVRAAHPTWGPRKVRAWLARREPAHAWPAASTIGALLQRHGLTVPRRRRRHAVPRPGARQRGRQRGVGGGLQGLVSHGRWAAVRPADDHGHLQSVPVALSARAADVRAGRGRCSRRRSGSMGCRSACAPTMGRPSPRWGPEACRAWPCGGFGSGSSRSASCRAIRNRMPSMNACTAR